jgi:ZIP family zinc transporter
MEDLFKIILYSFFAGVTVFLGGLLSKYFERYFQDGFVKEEILHTSIAFGGGIIVAAVALVLVPEGMNVLPLAPMAIIFLTGAIIFFFLDRYIEKKGGAISQLLAMLMDFDLRTSGYSSQKCLLILFLLSFSGIIAALLGYYLLSNMPKLTASMMLFSSGGILYLIFQDIAPMSKLKKSWFPALGASFGFLVGMIGQKILG